MGIQKPRWFTSCLMVVNCGGRVLITFEAWSNLAQQWFMCVPLGIHFEPINKDVSDNISIIDYAIWLKERTVLCQIRNSLGAMSLSKTLLWVVG